MKTIIKSFILGFITLIGCSCETPDRGHIEHINQVTEESLSFPEEMIGGYYSNAYNEEQGTITIDRYILYIQLENHIYQLLLEDAVYEQCNLIIIMADGTEIRIVNFTPYGYIRLTINDTIIGHYYKSESYGG